MEGCPAGDAGPVSKAGGGSDAQGFDYAILPPSFELDDKMSPLFASALFLEHDTPVAVQGSLNSLIRDKPMSP